MKKLLCVTGVALALMSVGAYADKIAAINVAKVFQESSATKSAVSKLEKEFKSREAEIQKLEKELQEMIQKAGANPSDSTRKSIESKGQALRDKVQKFQQDFQRRQLEENKNILSKIQGSAKSIASKEGYDLVVDGNAVIFAKDPSSVIDITSQVLPQVK